jgi:phage terminase small subunit
MQTTLNDLINTIMAKQEDNIKPKLTDKQERFCYEYCIDMNATQAAIRAGYSQDTAYSIGTENLKKPEIKERIDYMKANLAETAGISALKVIQEHAKLAFSSVADLFTGWFERTEFDLLTPEQKACIKSINTKVLKKNIGTSDEPEIVDVEYVKIECYDKQKSLDAINAMLGFNAPIKQEIKGEGYGPVAVFLDGQVLQASSIKVSAPENQNDA